LRAECLGEAFDQGLAEQVEGVLRDAALPHVDQLHRRHRQIHHALGQANPREAAARLAIAQRLQRRRGGAQDAVRAGQLRAFDRDVATVIARDGVLFVAGLVLLVHNDEAQVGQRREDGRAGADDDVALAGAYLLPLHVALAGGEARVHHGDALKAHAEALHRLGGQCDFGQQNNRRTALLQDPADGADVELGLAAVGDAVQERHAEAARLDLPADVVEGLSLVGVQDDLVRCGRHAFGDDGQSREHLLLGDSDDLLVGQVLERGRPAVHRGQHPVGLDRRLGRDSLALAQQGHQLLLLRALQGVRDFLRRDEIDQPLRAHAGGPLDRARDHRRQHLAQRTDVVVADPAGQLHQLGIEQGPLVHDARHGLEADAPVGAAEGSLAREIRLDAEPFFEPVTSTEGDLDPLADRHGPERIGHEVVELRIGRRRQRHADDVRADGRLRLLDTEQAGGLVLLSHGPNRRRPACAATSPRSRCPRTRPGRCGPAGS